MGTPVAFDTETHLIRPGLLAPPMVCLSSAIPATGARLWHVRPEMVPGGPLWANGTEAEAGTAEEHFEWILEQDPIYGLNVAFDMAVCLAQWPDLFPQVFRAYDESRVIDIGLCQMLIDNSTGRMQHFLNVKGYSLAGLAKRILKKDRSAEKEDPDAWRLRYSELENVPLSEWPQAAFSYAMDDAQDTLDIATHQWLKHKDMMGDAPAQARAAFALQLMMCWGVRTDKEQIQRLQEASEGKYLELTAELVAAGLVRGDDAGKQSGTRNVRAAQARMLEIRRAAGLPLTLTKTGYKKFKEFTEGLRKAKPEDVFDEETLIKYIAVDEDACKECGDDLMYNYSVRTQLHNILNTHIPDLLKGVDAPIQPRYNTFVESGRTSCSKSRSDDKKKKSPTNGFQFQNPKRALDYFPAGVGIRECFIARPKKFYADDDYSGLELHTGAQVCISTVGYSRLAEALNAGRDPHLQLGAKLMGISYEEAQARKHEPEVKKHRQLAKIPNFGLPGGMGIPGLIGFARGYGVKLTREEAGALKSEWLEEFPEWNDYFKYIRSYIDRVTGKGQIVQLFVNRLRGGVTFTSACNSFFQGLGADVAKRGLYEVTKRCYMRTEGSMLYGARPVGFIHDEILAEVDEEIAHEQATEIAQVMVKEGNVYLPDVPVRCEPALCKRWSKEAEAIYDGNGRLQPYDLAKEGKWKVFWPDGQQVEWR